MIYVVIYVDPYEEGVPSEVRSAWTRREDAEEAVRAEQRRISSIDWQLIKGYEIVGVDMDSGVGPHERTLAAAERVIAAWLVNGRGGGGGVLGILSTAATDAGGTVSEQQQFSAGIASAMRDFGMGAGLDALFEQQRLIAREPGNVLLTGDDPTRLDMVRGMAKSLGVRIGVSRVMRPGRVLIMSEDEAPPVDYYVEPGA